MIISIVEETVSRWVLGLVIQGPNEGKLKLQEGTLLTIV